MKRFRISVNGNSYDVEVEELDGATETSAPTPVQKSTPKPAASAVKKPKKSAPKPKETTPAPAGGHSIESPMPGTILSIAVSEGDSVSNGDVLLVLEAMKMENEITSDIDGTVSSINIGNGDAVDAGEVLVVIE